MTEYDAVTGCRRRLVEVGGTPLRLAYAPGGGSLVVLTRERTVFAWDTTTWARRLLLPADPKYSGRKLAAGLLAVSGVRGGRAAGAGLEGGGRRGEERGGRWAGLGGRWEGARRSGLVRGAAALALLQRILWIGTRSGTQTPLLLLLMIPLRPPPPAADHPAPPAPGPRPPQGQHPIVFFTPVGKTTVRMVHTVTPALPKGAKPEREAVPGVKLKWENKKPILGLAASPFGEGG